MKNCDFAFFSSASRVTYTLHNDHVTSIKTKEIPVDDFPPKEPRISITNHLSQSDAARKIQSAYKSHIIRTHYRKISAVNCEADQLQRLIQRQETVDAIRNDQREKLRLNEALMSLLLRLDSVPGIDQTVREARRKVSRRIVGLQEIMDGICCGGIDDYGLCSDTGYLRDWDVVVSEMEEEVCKERGGEEMERFCAEYLGFRCLQRFLREP
ncbi:BAG family molecular chaperone regulator 5, mitochondrial [Mercurialis annua]|uniref:BAG family molecular chaperone regulator 5, mitochondrial n=1 Tax=Mercurialis annua TaxID=3986 RepID=UPI00215F6908|nr:BAG family molecular chaperone regulator 5, mitochondrial [Mercurialis annua]XP_050208967.1 BAG family molecular chaperone regulator 5, mitochondrial [Mercurialis annua]